MGRIEEIEARIAAKMAEIDRRVDGLGASSVATDVAAGSRVVAATDGKGREGTRYGLYVGVNNYALPYNPLSGCVADAQNMVDVCRDLGGWTAANQTLLTDSSATIAAVRGSLRALADKARPGDVILYFQSSHGGPNGNAPASNDTCLCLHDGPYYEKQLHEDISQFRSGVKLVIVIDACYSGGLFQRGGARIAPADAMAEDVIARFRNAPVEGRISEDDIGWITASDNGQVSLDHPSNAGGYFTTFTLVNNGWRGGMADGFVDALLASNPGRDIGALAPLLGGQLNVAPAKSNGFVTFLDLAMFSIYSWRNWQTSDGNKHVPQCHNAEVLRSVTAGRTGVSPASRGDDYEYYCSNCGFRWHSDSYTVRRCKKCGGEAVLVS